MTDRCYKQSDFDVLLNLDPAAPERRHLHGCPRCQARFLAYEEFVRDLTAPSGADPADAIVRLTAAFRAEQATQLEQSRELKRAGQPDQAAARRRPRGPSFSLGALLRKPILAPAWAAAALVLIVIGLHGILDWPPLRKEADTLRALPPAGQTVEPGSIELLDPRPLSDGGLEIRWRPVTGAELYQVHLMGSSLEDLARYGPLPDTVLVLSSEVVRNLRRPDVSLAVQVEGLAQGRTVATSTIRAVPLR